MAFVSLTFFSLSPSVSRALPRTDSDNLICDEHVQFLLNKIDLNSISLRFLLCCADRSGIEDVMFESVLPLQTSMIPHYEQTIEFKDLPQVYSQYFACLPSKFIVLGYLC